jgi:hypothetical protein
LAVGVLSTIPLVAHVIFGRDPNRAEGEQIHETEDAGQLV